MELRSYGRGRRNRRGGDDLLLAPGGILLLAGPVGGDVPTLEIRYQDGSVRSVPLREQRALFEVARRDYAAGAGPWRWWVATLRATSSRPSGCRGRGESRPRGRRKVALAADDVSPSRP
jgi:hypothetical protein